MPAKKEKRPRGKTWRELKKNCSKQKSKRDVPPTWNARLRRIVSLLKKMAALGVIVVFAAVLWFAWLKRNDIFGIADSKVTKIEFKSDGVLNGKWLEGNINIPRGSTLAKIDIFDIKEKLENVGQIRSAKVERIFPDVLRISIEENSAFAKIRIKGSQDFRAVSRDGLVFPASGALEGALEFLPEIIGSKVDFDEKGDAVCSNSREIAEFLDIAKRKNPEFFKSWKLADTSQIKSLTLPTVTIQTVSGLKIIFLAYDYEKQFDRLEYILRYAQEKNISKFEKIDLTLKDRAVVKKSE